MGYKNEGALICRPWVRVLKETLAPEQSRLSFVDWLRLGLVNCHKSSLLAGINTR